MRKTGIFRTTLILALALTGISAGVYASEGWREYRSKSGVYRSRVPNAYELKTSSFNFGSGALATSEELSKTVDQRPYTNNVKTYIIKFDQTIGPALTAEEVGILLREELALYKSYYQTLNGKVVDMNDERVMGHWGGELHMIYDDPDMGQQHFKVRILFSESTKLNQIVMGSDRTMNSYSTRDFFDKFVFYEGMSKAEDTIENTWPPLTAPKGRFTIQHPSELVVPYYTDEPLVKETHNSDYVGLVFKDPVRNHRLFYNVYSFSFGANLDFRNAQQVLFEKVIKKHRNSARGLYFNRKVDKENNSSIIDVTYNVNPQDGLPSFVQTIKVRAHFRGKTMVVQEMMSSQILLRSSFAEKIMGLFYFHPEGPEGLVIEKTPTADESGKEAKPADQLLNWD